MPSTNKTDVLKLNQYIKTDIPSYFDYNDDMKKIDELAKNHNLKIKKLPLDIYPVGSIYMSGNSTSPAELFGGTWEKIENRFLIGASSNYPVGSVGGSPTHTNTVKEMAPHHHRGYLDNGTCSACSTAKAGIYNHGNPTQDSVWAGEGQPYSILNPYLAIYIWKRIA